MTASALDTALPGFVKSCSELHTALMPIGTALLAVAFIVEFWHGPPGPVELLKFLVKVFLIVVLMANSHDWINATQSFVQDWVQAHVPASPDQVAVRFKAKLAQAQETPEGEDSSFWDSLFNASSWFESGIALVLTVVAWIAMGILFFVNTVQWAILRLCWVLGVVLFPTLAIRPLSHLGMRHLLRTVAVILWPLAVALAATLTDGLLDTATDPNFLGNAGMVGALGRGLITLLCLVVIAVWIMVSTIAGPVFIQLLLTGSAGPAAALTKATDLVTNTGLPSGFGVPAAGRAVYRLGRSVYERVRPQRSSRSDDVWARGEDALQARRHRPPAQSPWRPPPDDPTGDRKARNIFC